MLALLSGLRQSSGCCRLSCSSNCAPLCALCENDETNQNTSVVLQALANLPALLYPVVKFSHGDELTDILDDKRALLHFVVNSQTPATRCRSCHLKKVNFQLLKLLLPRFCLIIGKEHHDTQGYELLKNKLTEILYSNLFK